MAQEEEREVKTKLYEQFALISPAFGRRSRWLMGISFLPSWLNVIWGQAWSGANGFIRKCPLVKDATFR